MYHPWAGLNIYKKEYCNDHKNDHYNIVFVKKIKYLKKLN
jgi:hypothetical protein